jgi:hypothetical protein
LALLASLLAGTALAQAPGDAGPWVVRVRYTDRAQLDQLTAEREPWQVRPDLREAVFEVDRAGLEGLRAAGFVPEIDALRTDELRRPRVPLPGQVNGIPGFLCYRTVEETYAAAQALTVSYPQLATWIDVGDSWEKSQGGGPPGYDLMLLRLTNAATPGPKPRLFVNAAIHAREYTTAELVTRFAEQLLAGHGSDPDVTWMLDTQEIHLLLQSNPDGRKRAEAGSSWRKNTDSDYCGTPSAQGIDLNRNFPYNWGCCGGSSGNGCLETYRGPAPASEPEAQAVRNHMLAIFPDYGDPQVAPIPSDAAGIFLDIHSSGQLVMWPWGYTGSPTPNATALQTLGRKFAYFNNHTPYQANNLYTTDGTTRDFGYGELGVPSYTFELGTSFFQDCATFENTILPTNLAALRYAARVTRRPYLLPAGPEALAVAATPASVNAGQPVALTATLNDTRFNNSNGSEPAQNVVAAEAYVDTPPWAPAATPVALAAADGGFDETIEPVQGTLQTAGWPTGRHLVFVRGLDAAGNWGPVAAVFVDVAVPVELQELQIE